MGKKILPLWADMVVKGRNKILKPGESPFTVDTYYANNPKFLAAYHKGNGSAPILGASSTSNVNVDDVKKRLAAQLGSSTILGANSSSLGG